MYNIFCAHNKRDEHQLEKLFSNIDENPLNLWQLDTNADFRGIMEFSYKMKTIYNMDINPDFYLCSCGTTPYTKDSKPFLDESYDNGKTEIKITNQFKIEEHYEHINDFLAYGSYPRCGGSIPIFDGGSGRPFSLEETAYILNVKIESEQLSSFSKNILYMGYSYQRVIRKFLMAKSDDFSNTEDLRSRIFLMGIFPRTYTEPREKQLSILEEKLDSELKSFFKNKSDLAGDFYSNRTKFVLIGNEITCYDSSYNIIYQI